MFEVWQDSDYTIRIVVVGEAMPAGWDFLYTGDSVEDCNQFILWNVEQ